MQRDIESRLSKHAEITDAAECREPRSTILNTKRTTGPAIYVETVLEGPHYDKFQSAF